MDAGQHFWVVVLLCEFRFMPGSGLRALLT